MRKCLKCQMIYMDASKICRSCGSIIDDVDEAANDDEAPAPTAEESPTVAAPLDEEAFEEAIGPALIAAADRLPTTDRRDDWICLNCGERVPRQFDVCWNCFAPSADSPDGSEAISVDRPGGAPTPNTNAADSREGLPQRPARARPCPACGSAKIIPSLGVVDHEGYGVKVSVEGNPEAVFFKDRRHGSLVADVCGECGHVEIQVGNFAQLYEHYLWSQER